jgi:hypothetical protein
VREKRWGRDRGARHQFTASMMKDNHSREQESHVKTVLQAEQSPTVG